ncbi:MAG: SDR family NAD(P)-dependent oxidoreductase [Gluconobacter potus]|uniref:SDR family oxidoreductase n=1 Tax=Gluconobacter potus TaxID=2724927 RepID=A0ABR9YJY8_9PROT|nr:MULTISPECIES: SDR family NAD(P)-dependent oxidoreductase [Gluconobacter]MBF0864325.1 SDR family oxidoreductase [Gluconobacter sp. R71656]MBF0867793.1 SDR family oxidoreductase [Gluconobacter sp. R75628]MBF0872718.1 SDR family oxidoreductase [Gluconobacter sp. R75629]MBF0881964.1 SDR family oxidoreductase [Gluconobacter potus]
MDLQLKNKTALVTGSSKGIGSAIAENLAREGAIVVVHGRDRVQAQHVMDSILAAGGIAHVVLGDLTQQETVERLVSEAHKLVGPIDILINNAGASGVKSDWRTTSAAEWSATYDRNVLAAVRVSMCLLPAMRLAGWGRVINISSGAATLPPANAPDYSAAKAAMNAMSASMAKAVAADGVTVNAVSPGTIKSLRLEEAFRAAAAAQGLAAADAAWDEIQRVVLPLFANVPMGRVGQLSELANAVTFLASPLAGYITGVNLHVDGGFSCIP